MVWGSRLGDLGFHLSQRKAEKAGESLVAQRTDGWKKLDMGIRSFFGGYDPDKRDDYASRIFFNSAAVRFAC